MIKAINKIATRGQTALILILLAAAALIFLAVVLNWGRIAQTKVLLSVAADESASLLASDTASYGEMQKQTYLKDENQITESTGIWVAIAMVVVAVVISIVSWGSAAPLMSVFMTEVLLVASVVMAVANLVLQVVVVQPGITSLWNSLQKNQPIQQQFYEQGIATALQESVTDQVTVTDYFDSNTNGVFGNSASGFANDVVSRFALYYTDRLKMLNQPLIPQVVFFYNQLQELMNGETCYQNVKDNASYPGIIALNPACAALGCSNSSTDPACEIKIPDGFQLSDACTGSNPANTSTYSPYCDPCCQPNPPSSCTAGSANCSINNPYNAYGSWPYLYDASFQNYASGISFLDQFGRDQQMGPFSTSLNPQGSSANGLFFPNGIYPFFWLMNYYSPEVDTINSSALQPSQDHWCTTGVAPSYAPPTGYADLTQLSLPYSCSGQDCCVNYLGSAVNGAIDMVGAPSFPYNPPLYNPAQDQSFGESGSGSWLPGDNQMCSAASPYNGNSPSYPGILDGTCEWTGSTAAPTSATPIPGVSSVDGLDDAMHTLSDFVTFSGSVLDKDVGTLSSTFQTWYPQVAAWIDPASGRLLSLPTTLNTWNGVISSWLNISYASSNAWCIPPGTTGSAAEDAAINSGGTWGSLPSVIACLNYNATTPVSNYQSCLTALQASTCPANYATTPPPECAASALGRSLAGPAPAYDGCIGQYETWVQNSQTMATNEAPKFALRAQFLNDIYTRAKTMQSIFSQGALAIQNFLNAAAQLTAAYNQPQPTAALPNSVIYGWVDNTYPNGQAGHAHIVKVTAYSTGRCGGSCAGSGNVSANGIDSIMPWIKTKTSGFFATTRSYTLTDRDGYVYVKVQRWDEDHSNSILFPNGHTLWQFLFHNPNGGAASTGQGGLIPACNGLPLPSGGSIGFGFMPRTATGLGVANISPQDQAALGNAFMLNDEEKGSANVDPSAKNNSNYDSCFNQANDFLANAPYSEACAQYIASSNASGNSGNEGPDYSLKFINCNSLPGGIPPDDLASDTTG